VFSAWAKVITLFCASCKLLLSEQEELVEEVAEFERVYLSKTSGSITLKLHHLFSHAKDTIEMYGTIGFSAEKWNGIHPCIV